MAGHSKWAKIKRDKGANDAKRGAVYTRIGNQIAIAARAGTDPAFNPSLAVAIETAKAANMPLANIERAIERVKDKSAADLQEILYEGYGPGGVGILVECATDNVNRTYPEVKSAFSKNGGSIAEKGAVSFQFDRVGKIVLVGDDEETLLTALDAGAMDADQSDGETIIYTDPKELMAVRAALIERGREPSSAELTYEPKNTVELESDEKIGKAVRLLEALEDIDDVVATHTNMA